MPGQPRGAGCVFAKRNSDVRSNTKEPLPCWPSSQPALRVKKIKVSSAYILLWFVYLHSISHNKATRLHKRSAATRSHADLPAHTRRSPTRRKRKKERNYRSTGKKLEAYIETGTTNGYNGWTVTRARKRRSTSAKRTKFGLDNAAARYLLFVERPDPRSCDQERDRLVPREL